MSTSSFTQMKITTINSCASRSLQSPKTAYSKYSIKYRLPSLAPATRSHMSKIIFSSSISMKTVSSVINKILSRQISYLFIQLSNNCRHRQQRSSDRAVVVIGHIQPLVTFSHWSLVTITYIWPRKFKSAIDI